MAPTEKNDVKELTRKLYWAISSTLRNLDKQQRTDTFNWAARMAERIIADCVPSLPLPVDTGSRNRYAGQAEGRGGGRNNPSHTRGRTPSPPPDQEAWETAQAAMRRRAWVYVQRGRREGDQLPLPVEVYREVGNGSSNRTG